jgi:hypothetical protein
MEPLFVTSTRKVVGVADTAIATVSPAGVADGAGDELGDQQLGVAQPRLADQVQVAVERRERLAGRRWCLWPARKL